LGGDFIGHGEKKKSGKHVSNTKWLPT